MTVDRKVCGWRHFYFGWWVLGLVLALHHGFDDNPGLTTCLMALMTVQISRM